MTALITASEPAAKSPSVTHLALGIVFLQVFLSEMPRGIVLPGMRPHLAQLSAAPRQYNAYCVSLFSLGRLSASVPFGYLVDQTRSSRNVFILASFITIAGQCLYMIPDLVAILLSQFLVGVASTSAQRTQFMANNTLVQYVGLTVGPLLATVLPGGAVAPSLAVIVIKVVMMGVLAQLLAPTDAGSDDSSESEPVALGATLRCDSAFALFMFLNFSVHGVVAITEVVAAPQYQALYAVADPDDAVDDSAEFLFLLGVIGIGTFLSLRLLDRIMSPMALVQMGMGAVLIGSVTILGSGDNQVGYTIGMVLIWSIGSPIAQVLTISAYSRLIGSRSQGVIMGWLTTSGGAGRILLPIVATADVTIAYAVNIATVTLAMVLVAVFARSRSKKSPRP